MFILENIYMKFSKEKILKDLDETILEIKINFFKEMYKSRLSRMLHIKINNLVDKLDNLDFNPKNLK